MVSIAIRRSIGHNHSVPDIVTPALYEARVEHDRREKLDKAFDHRVHMWLVDLDELPHYRWPLGSFARFRASDHLGEPTRSIRSNVDDFLRGNGVQLGGGRIMMLANAASLGYNFNPLSVFWCYHAEGHLECIVAEVHNTYGQRHCYLLRPDDVGRVRTDKQFYVSPFFTIDGEYLMRFSPPGPQLSVTIALQRDGHTVFSARLRGSRVPATTLTVLRKVVRRPLMSLWVTALIHWHGITLWLRGLPVIPRTKSGLKETLR